MKDKVGESKLMDDQFLDDDELSVLEIFRKAVSLGCSDIHVKPGSPPKMRKNGSLIAVPGYESVILDGVATERLTQETMASEPKAFSYYNTPDVNQHDYSLELEDVGRFRMNAYKTRGNDAFVARLLSNSPRTLDELGVDPNIKKLALSKSGLVIVTGATGSGKSATMAGMVQHINVNLPVNIISAEDPIEIILSDAMASISQREIGVDVDSFDSALVSALREDPDVILIGEIRHADTLKTALQAADTGHLVVATLHTTDATKAINRIMALATENDKELIRQQLSTVLKGIIGQRLVPSTSGGRIGVNEILINTPEIAAMIAQNAPEVELRAVLERSSSMITFEQSFIKHVEAGRITMKTAKDFSDYKEYYDKVKINLPNSENKDTVKASPKPHIPSFPAATNKQEPAAPNFPKPTNFKKPNLPGLKNKK